MLLRQASEGEGIQQERSGGVELDGSPSRAMITSESAVQCESGFGIQRRADGGSGSTCLIRSG